MNNAIINIRIDKEVKEKAQKLAQALGFPLSTILNAYLNQFIRTKEVHFYLEGKLKPSVKKRLNRFQREVMENKNLSPTFRTGQEMDDYLKSLTK